MGNWTGSASRTQNQLRSSDDIYDKAKRYHVDKKTIFRTKLNKNTSSYTCFPRRGFPSLLSNTVREGLKPPSCNTSFFSFFQTLTHSFNLHSTLSWSKKPYTAIEEEKRPSSSKYIILYLSPFLVDAFLWMCLRRKQLLQIQPLQITHTLAGRISVSFQKGLAEQFQNSCATQQLHCYANLRTHP